MEKITSLDDIQHALAQRKTFKHDVNGRFYFLTWPALLRLELHEVIDMINAGALYTTTEEF